MDYISVFGIRSAVLILGWGISGTAVTNAAAINISPVSAMAMQQIVDTQNASVTVNISGLRNLKGQILICLSSNEKEFPDCRKDETAQKKNIPAAHNSQVVFENVAPGDYALALVHDKNSNGKMDLALFLPKEGFGMSNNPKVRMGKPKFKNSKFTVGNDNIVKDIKMKYIL